MATIDVSKIEGYAEMTAEQKVAALEQYALPDADYTGYVKKDVFDKAASEAADWKKKHNALLSDEEKKSQETADLLEQYKQKAERLEKEQMVSGYKAKYLAMGYDERLADDTAQAYADGNAEKVFANQLTFIANHDKQIKAETMKNVPTPPAGTGTDSATTQRGIDNALARGDFTTAAALMRQMQENK